MGMWETKKESVRKRAWEGEIDIERDKRKW